MKPRPTRVDEGTTEFERQLLRAYTLEGPSEEARGKAAVAIGLGIGAGLGASAAAAIAGVPKTTLPMLALGGKALTTGMLIIALTGLTAGGYALLTPMEAPVRSPVPVVEPSLPHSTPSSSSRSSDATRVGPARATAAPSPELPATTGSVSRSSPPTASIGSSDARPSRDRVLLEEQVAALDRAREALSSGDTEGASQRIDAYEREFPQGALSQESTMLRIEILLKEGKRDAARALADRFLAANPASPYAGRIRSLLGANP